MYFHGYDPEKAIANCSARSSGQAQTGSIHSWQKLEPEQVMSLLEDATLPARHQARALAGLLQQVSWHIVPNAAQVGGTDNKLAGTNKSTKIGLSVGGRVYHLHCEESPSLEVVEITG